MSSIQVIAKLHSNKNDLSLYKTVSEKELSEVNNYFEVVYGNKPMRVYIDLDGHLRDTGSIDEPEIPNIDEYYHPEILKKLKTLKDVSIMSSSSQDKYILSYCITYINEYCNDNETLKKVVERKFKEIKKLLKISKIGPD